MSSDSPGSYGRQRRTAAEPEQATRARPCNRHDQQVRRRHQWKSSSGRCPRPGGQKTSPGETRQYVIARATKIRDVRRVERSVGHQPATLGSETIAATIQIAARNATPATAIPDARRRQAKAVAIASATAITPEPSAPGRTRAAWLAAPHSRSAWLTLRRARDANKHDSESAGPTVFPRTSTSSLATVRPRSRTVQGQIEPQPFRRSSGWPASPIRTRTREVAAGGNWPAAAYDAQGSRRRARGAAMPARQVKFQS